MKLDNIYADTLLNKELSRKVPDFELRGIISTMKGTVAGYLEATGSKDAEVLAAKITAIIHESNDNWDESGS